MIHNEYIEKFKKHFGYRDNYFPKDSYEKVANWLDDELRLKMPTDTAAREVEGDAVMLLVASKDPEAIEVGKWLGNIMMGKGIDDYVLLSAMEDAAVKLHKMARRK